MCCCGILGGCCTTCLLGCCWSGLQECNGKRGAPSRLPYLLILILGCVFSLIMTFYGEKKLYSIDSLNASLKICNSDSCKGNGVVYRTSFALFMFFLIHAVLVRLIREIHWMFFILKLILLIGFLIGSFWIPNDFYEGYAEFARVASAVYLVIQLMILISWAWECSEKVLSRIEGLENQTDENNKCQIGWFKFFLISGTIFLIGVTITLWVLMFFWFGKSGCMFNQALISLTIIATIVLNIVALCVDHGSVFVTAIVSLYGTYLCYSGLQVGAGAGCNSFAGHKNSLTLWIGIIIILATLCYQGSAMSETKFSNDASDCSKESDDACEEKADKKNMETDEIGENERLGPDNKKSNYDDLEEGGKRANNTDNDNKNVQISEEDKERNKNVLFHVAMTFASIYFAMLFTNWATDTASPRTANRRSDISFGVNIGSEWLCFILYLWTLCAPKICTNRSFY